jgi:hypothetical protein
MKRFAALLLLTLAPLAGFAGDNNDTTNLYAPLVADNILHVTYEVEAISGTWTCSAASTTCDGVSGADTSEVTADVTSLVCDGESVYVDSITDTDTFERHRLCRFRTSTACVEYYPLAAITAKTCYVVGGAHATTRGQIYDGANHALPLHLSQAAVGISGTLFYGTSWDLQDYDDGASHWFCIGSGDGSGCDGLAVAKTFDLGIVADSTSGLRFGDGDTQFYESADDTLAVMAGGVNIANITATAILSGATGGFYLQQAIGSATDPIFAFRGDADGGLTRPAADQVGLCAGGVAVLHATSSLVSFPVNIGAYPPATCVAGAVFIDTDESDDTNCVTTADNSLCLCVVTDTWVSLENN